MARTVKFLLTLSIFFLCLQVDALAGTPLPRLRGDTSILNRDNAITAVIKSGDTLSNLLHAADISQGEILAAITELNTLFDPANLKAGQHITIYFGAPQNGNQRSLDGLEIRLSPDKLVTLAHLYEDVFLAKEVGKEVANHLIRAEGTITSTLFSAGSAANIPPRIMAEMVKLYSYDVDFQRDIRKGNKFRILYEKQITEDGLTAGSGDIIYASLELHDRTLPIYRYETLDGSAEYFNEAGVSIRKSFLRTPIDGAQISSGFGMRSHPILGYSKMHKGVDFAAPTGTPVYASGDGIIERAGRFSSYGNYIRIRHANGYDSAYAHLSRYAKGIRKGVHVKQGDVIGFVGTTGRSTGPHLHYELLVYNEQIDPQSVDMNANLQLTGISYGIFQSYRKQVDTAFTTFPTSQQLAEVR